jgi:O-antigen ligase
MALYSTAQPITLARPALLVAGVLTLGAAAGAAIATGHGAYLVPAIALLLVFRWPIQVALGSYAFLVPFEQIPLSGHGPGVSPTFCAGLLTLGAILAVGLMEDRFVPPPKSAIWWSLFVVWGALTIAWAVDTDTSLARLRTAVSLLALYVLATSFRFTKREFNAIRLFALGGGVLASLLVIAELFAGIHLTGTHRGTLVINGTEADPNFLSASLMLPFSLALAGCIENRGIRRVLMVLAAITFVLGVAVTGSRGGMLGLMMCVFVFLLRMRIDRRVVAVVLCTALVLAFLPGPLLSRITKSDDGGAGRLKIWAIGVQAIPHYLIQGAGWDNFPSVFAEYSGGIDALDYGTGRGSHNLWLGITVELGFLGLLFLFLAMRSQLRKQRSPNLTPYIAGCWGFLTAGMFLDVAWKNAFWLAWILLALATQLEHRTELQEATE